MNHSSVRIRAYISAIAVVILLSLAGVCRAQGTNPNLQTDKEAADTQDRQMRVRALANTDEAASAKIDPKEEAAYKAFFDTPSQDADKRIQLGQSFVGQYPQSHYAESVYAGLVQAFYAKQDWTNFYSSSDKALALQPDDAHVLIIVGWVIPHVLVGNEPDASDRLDQAEKYEKKAMQVVADQPKPANMTDDQFALYKANLFNQAHSGLGLVYFRRQQYEDSAKELQQATQGATRPDPTDLYAMGADLFNLKRYSEAADAFGKCAQLPSGLTDSCKQQAERARTLAAQLK